MLNTCQWLAQLRICPQALFEPRNSFADHVVIQVPEPPTQFGQTQPPSGSLHELVRGLLKFGFH